MASGILLSEREREEFRAAYGEVIRKQCVLLMGDTKAAKDLENRVLEYIHKKYEYQPLPEHCETMLIATCCILSSRMLSPDMGEEPGAGATVRTKDVKPDTIPEIQPEDLPEEIRNIRVTAAYDPEKTAVWFPNDIQPDNVHTMADPEDPEDMTSERSVAHSIFNTFLAIAFLGSIGFFMWKTGILQWLKRLLEGLFIYG